MHRRLRRRAALLRARVSVSMGRIFGGARELWGGLGLHEKGDVEFLQRLEGFRAATEELIGRDEEVEVVAAGEARAAEAAANAGEAAPSASASSFRQRIYDMVTPRHGIVVHDGCARRSGDDWLVPFEAWVYRENKGRHAIRLALCQKLLIELKHGIRNVSSAAQQRYEDRGRLIFRNLAFRGAAAGSRLRVRFGGQDRWRELPDADDTGRITADIRLSCAEMEQLVGGEFFLHMQVHGALLGTRQPAAGAKIRLTEEYGLSIISDVDDTVKVTEVFAGKDTVVRNSFFEEYQAVPGMPELFQKWAASVPAASFHFVSNSPPELLEPLRDFLREASFPLAPLHLRPLWGKERADFKARTTLAILQQFPHRRFILVGDSGERDPHMCADLMRSFPDQVAYILIREVIPSLPVDASVFEGLDPARWQVFRDPSEVNLPLSELLPVR